MAKNVMNTAFRKVDVDQYEEEKYEDDVVADTGVTGPSEPEVQALLSKYPLNDPSLPRNFVNSIV